MLKVLVVDDEVEITDFLCRFLNRFRISSSKANNGAEALKVFDQVKPDWMLLDIKMPDMDGFELLESLRGKDYPVKVIMITGREDKESQEKAKRLGALDYIVKPLDLEELHHKVNSYILKN